MKKRLFILCVVFVILLTFFTGSLIVSAKEEKSGFIQCYTKASINFAEVIEFTLTNKETGEVISYRLYWINEYEGNFAVPFGTYSVSAKVIVESGWAEGLYEVICSPEEITVNKTNLAEGLGFRVEEIAAGDVSDTSWSDYEPITPSPDVPVDPDNNKDNVGEGVQAEQGSVSRPADTSEASSSREVHPIVGIIVSAVALLLVGGIVFYIMWRRENPDLD